MRRTGAPAVTEHELLRIIDFLERVRRPFAASVPIAEADPAWNITAHLVRAHLKGEPVTTTALAEAAGVPYATAMRRIHGLIDHGFIAKLPASRTGKSFRLKPSDALLAAFVAQAKQVKTVLAETLGQRRDADRDEDYYFGGADFVGETLPPPALVRRRQEGGADLRFLLNDDNYFAAMRNMWADLRNNLASRRNFTLMALPELHARLRANARLPVSEFDIVACNMPWLGEFAGEGLLRPLDRYVSAESLNPLDFHPAVWTTGQWGDQQFGVPIYCTIEIMAARRDWFAEAGLAFPRTFDEVIAAARALHRPDQGRYGIGWNCARGMPVASSFMVLMGCCGAPILNLPRARRYYQWASTRGDALRPRIATDEGRAVLDYMHRLLAVSPPDILEMDWNGRVNAFLAGRVSMTYCWSMAAARFEYDVASTVKRRVAYLPQPKGPSGMTANPIGGFLLSIPANLPEDRAALAYEAIAWMASPSSMKAHVTNGFPVAPRFSVAADPEAQASSPIVRFIDKLAQRGLLCTWQRPPVPEYAVIERSLGEHIHAALRGEVSDEAALAGAQADIDAEMRARGRY